MIYLNVYRITQAYGGREEGGWWYDVGEPLASVPIEGTPSSDTLKNPDDPEHTIYVPATPTDAHAAALMENHLRDMFIDKDDRELKRGRTSCAGGYDLSFDYEDGLAEFYPNNKPHYE